MVHFSRIFLSTIASVKLNGHIWAGFSSTVNNTAHKAIQTLDKGYVLATNLGAWMNYDILVVKLNEFGEVVWRKVMNGSRDDQVKDIQQTPDGGYILVGGTNSYGMDTNGSLSYMDIYVVKLDADGEEEWTRTYGNFQTIDNARNVINTSDGGYAVTGRMIERGAFHVFLLKLDADGNTDFIKTYGDTLHRNYAFGLMEDNGNFLITGSTTLLKSDHTAMADAFLIKTDTAGDILWARAYLGSNSDRSDIGSGIVKTDDGGYALPIATMSYPTIGFVPNKHVVIKTDADGHIDNVRSYNDGGSHYTNMATVKVDSGYAVGGFSNANTTDFSTTVYRTNEELGSGCNEKDLSGLTFQQDVPFVTTIPEYETGAGSVWATNTYRDSATFTIMTLCEEIIVQCDSLINPVYAPNAVFSNVLLYPNPVTTNTLYLQLEVQNSDDLTVQVIDFQGKIVANDAIHIVPGNHVFSLSVPDLSSGMYYLRIANRTQNETLKFVVVR